MIHVTDDIEFIKTVMANDAVWPHVSDDMCGNKDEFEPDTGLLYLSVEDDGERVGFFAVSAINSICCEIHTVMLPIAWGKTLRYTAEVIDWLFIETGFLKIMTFVPEINKKALNLALKSGLKIEGYLSHSFIKDGNLIGQHILGVCKGDACH
jgi:RimJ/RimL family protein N-acetyltransferase